MSKPSVRAIVDKDVDEVFPADVAAVHLDDSNFVILKLQFRVLSGEHGSSV